MNRTNLAHLDAPFPARRKRRLHGEDVELVVWPHCGERLISPRGAVRRVAS